MLNLPFTSPQAKQFNKNIFETIYYHSLKKSSELATIHGSYDNFLVPLHLREFYSLICGIQNLKDIQKVNGYF